MNKNIVEKIIVPFFLGPLFLGILGAVIVLGVYGWCRLFVLIMLIDNPFLRAGLTGFLAMFSLGLLIGLTDLYKEKTSFETKRKET